MQPNGLCVAWSQRHVTGTTCSALTVEAEQAMSKNVNLHPSFVPSTSLIIDMGFFSRGWFYRRGFLAMARLKKMNRNGQLLGINCPPLRRLFPTLHSLSTISHPNQRAESSRLSKLDNGFSVVDTLSSPLGAFASEELFLTTVMGWDGHDDLVDRSIDR